MSGQTGLPSLFGRYPAMPNAETTPATNGFISPFASQETLNPSTFPFPNFSHIFPPMKPAAQPEHPTNTVPFSGPALPSSHPPLFRDSFNQRQPGCQSTIPEVGNTGLFRQSAFGSQHRGSTAVPYTSTTIPDTGICSSGKLQSISAMPVYNEKCHEELRWEDYQLVYFGQTSSPFRPASSISKSSSSPFGQTSSSPYTFIPTNKGLSPGHACASSHPPPFGDNFNQRQPAGFDQKPNVDAAITINLTCGTAITITATAGSSVTVNTSTSGSTTITISPTTQTNNPPRFFGTSSSSFRGSTSTPGFGASSFPGFDASSTLGFGVSSPGFNVSSTPAFGGFTSNHDFGASSNPGFSVSSTPGFGVSSPFGAQISPFGAQSTIPGVKHTAIFGQSDFGGQLERTRTAPYTSTTHTEPERGSIAWKLESISPMPEYKDKNHKELRWEDYQLRDNGGPNPAGENGFGISTTQTKPLNPAPSLGHTSSSYSSIPATNTFPSTSPFGQTSSSPNPLIPASLFGQISSPFTSTPETSISTSSSSPFGQISSSPNPLIPASLFGHISSPFSSTPETSISTSSSSPFGQISSSSNPLSPAQSFGQTSSPFSSVPATSIFPSTSSSSPSPLSVPNQSSIPAFTFNPAPSIPQTPFSQAISATGGTTNLFGNQTNMFNTSAGLGSTSSNQIGFNQSVPSLFSFPPSMVGSQPLQTSTFGFNNTFHQTQPGITSGMDGSSSISGQNTLTEPSNTQESAAVQQPVPATDPFRMLHAAVLRM